MAAYIIAESNEKLFLLVGIVHELRVEEPKTGDSTISFFSYTNADQILSE